jgi:hypothetical protein
MAERRSNTAAQDRIRLQPEIEQRMVGFRVDPEKGLPVPHVKSFIIGHGQLLARKRWEVMAAGHPVTETVVSRQVRRAAERKTAKHAAAAERKAVVAGRRKKNAKVAKAA